MACADQLKVFADHMAKSDPGSSHMLRFVLVTNFLGGLAQYAEGDLTAWNPPVASGNGHRYSAYERWNFPAPPGQIFWDTKAYPFDPNRRDPITLSVNLTSGQVAGSFAFQALCENGLLYGFSTPSTSGFLKVPMMNVLALITESVPIPK